MDVAATINLIGVVVVVLGMKSRHLDVKALPVPSYCSHLMFLSQS